MKNNKILTFFCAFAQQIKKALSTKRKPIKWRLTSPTYRAVQISNAKKRKDSRLAVNQRRHQCKGLDLKR